MIRLLIARGVRCSGSVVVLTWFLVILATLLWTVTTVATKWLSLVPALSLAGLITSALVIG